MTWNGIHSKWHYFVLALIYIGAPFVLAWIGYHVSHYGHLPRFSNFKYQLEEFKAGSTVKSLYELPSLQLTMNAGTSTGTVKVSLTLEVNQKDLTRLPDYEPRIMERITLYLRNKSFDDIRDSKRMQALREGLVAEIDRGAVPIKVSDVIIKQMVFE